MFISWEYFVQEDLEDIVVSIATTLSRFCYMGSEYLDLLTTNLQHFQMFGLASTTNSFKSLSDTIYVKIHSYIVLLYRYTYTHIEMAQALRNRWLTKEFINMLAFFSSLFDVLYMKWFSQEITWSGFKGYFHLREL